jgi:hypothetical protein
LLKVMAGEGTAEGMGFHQIAMQIAITASALGKKEEEVLALSEGLIQNHVSDGSRYNTPHRRKVELQRMLRYCEGNVCYSYSVGASRRRLVPREPAPPRSGRLAAGGEGGLYRCERQRRGLVGEGIAVLNSPMLHGVQCKSYSDIKLQRELDVTVL